METYFKAVETETKDNCILIYESTKENMQEKFNEMFHLMGYKIQEISSDSIVITRGNRILRMLLGAFYKYFKFAVHFTASDEETKVYMNSQSSGISGGLIGLNQVKKEFSRLVDTAKRM